MVKQIVQRIISASSLIATMIFAVLSVLGIQVKINQNDINNVILGVGSLVLVLIEGVPFIISVIKDKNVAKATMIVNEIVRAVEEIKGQSSAEKKRKALKNAIEECAKQGLKVSEELLDTLIESAVKIRNGVVKANT